MSGPCQGGWYCRINATTARPEDGNVTGEKFSDFCMGLQTELSIDGS